MSRDDEILKLAEHEIGDCPSEAADTLTPVLNRLIQSIEHLSVRRRQSPRDTAKESMRRLMSTRFM